MKSLAAAALVLGLARSGRAETTAEPGAREPHYLEETSRAMDKMMACMNVPATGDVDADFVFMMVPHHRGAIEMAQAELAYGQNAILRRIAQGIIVAQVQEIEAMQLALGPMPATGGGQTGRSKPALPKLGGHCDAP